MRRCSDVRGRSTATDDDPIVATSVTLIVWRARARTHTPIASRCRLYSANAAGRTNGAPLSPACGGRSPKQRRSPPKKYNRTHKDITQPREAARDRSRSRDRALALARGKRACACSSVACGTAGVDIFKYRALNGRQYVLGDAASASDSQPASKQIML